MSINEKDKMIKQLLDDHSVAMAAAAVSMYS
jgi:hypothetical protein